MVSIQLLGDNSHLSKRAKPTIVKHAKHANQVSGWVGRVQSTGVLHINTTFAQICTIYMP